MAKFTEIPWFILKNYADEVISPNEPSEYSAYSGGTLFRANSSFITKNTNPFQLYKKSEKSDYEEVKASIQNNFYEERDVLKLKRLFSKKIVPSFDILRTIEESGYERITYDIYSDTDYVYDINNDDDIYVRKDSLFTNWLKNNNYSKYANPEKLFLYLGKGYKHDGYIEIIHYSLKNWIINALPENNRNETLNEFLYILYDDLQHQLLESQKNIFSLFDPYEITDDNIRDISLVYGEEPLSSEISNFKRRIYVDNLINWLKKKGTYSSLFIIWYILTKETDNTLTIYDGWHTKLPSGSSPEDYLEWYDYTNFYTSSLSADYPREYSLDNKVLSTHYKVEFDTNTNPFGEEILSENLMKDLYEKWENTRPVTRFAHYHLKSNIIADFSGDWKSLYADPIYDANFYSQSLLFTESASGSAIHVQTTALDEWVISHDLESRDVLTHVYDLNLKRIQPDEIVIFNSSTIRIHFKDPVAGSAFITKANYIRSQDFILNNWTITHLLNSKYVLSQFYDENVVQPSDVIAIDQDTLDVQTVGLSGYGFIAKSRYTHTQDTKSNEWTINHNLGYVGVMLDVYDGNDEKIMPNTILLNDINSCTVSFSKPISGYCGVIPAGNPSLGGDVSGKFDGEYIVKIGNGTDLDDWDYVVENDIKNTFYTAQCSASCFTQESEGVRFDLHIPKDIKGYITEIGIFNINDEISWITKVDNIYKHEEVVMNIDYYAQYENI